MSKEKRAIKCPICGENMIPRELSIDNFEVHDRSPLIFSDNNLPFYKLGLNREYHVTTGFAKAVCICGTELKVPYKDTEPFDTWIDEHRNVTILN